MLDHNWDEEKYVQSILKYKKYYEYIFFCIHQECYKKKKWLAPLKKYGIDFVIGANSHDKNSLIRTKLIFQHFETVLAPTIGAAIAYAALDDCKVSLSTDYLEYKIDGYVNHPLYNTKREYVEYEIYTKSKKYIEKNLTFFFVNLKKVKIIRFGQKKNLGLNIKKNLMKYHTYLDGIKRINLNYIHENI